MFSPTKCLLAAIAILALCTVEARADSFVISDIGGAVYISTSRDGGPSTLRMPPAFTLVGPGLRIFSQPINSLADAGQVQSRDTCLNAGCFPGAVLGMNSSFSGLIATPDLSGATVNGVSYGFVRITGSMSFFSDPIVIPNFSGDGKVTIPFTFLAQLTGEVQEFGVTNQIFTATITGQGLATFTFFARTTDPFDQHYLVDNIEYRFVPEPDALLLLSSGLTGLLGVSQWRRRVRRK